MRSMKECLNFFQLFTPHRRQPSQNFKDECEAVLSYPNATVAEYGTVIGEEEIMAEVFARGPVACEIDATPLHEYTVRALWRNALCQEIERVNHRVICTEHYVP